MHFSSKLRVLIFITTFLVVTPLLLFAQYHTFSINPYALKDRVFTFKYEAKSDSNTYSFGCYNSIYANSELGSLVYNGVKICPFFRYYMTNHKDSTMALPQGDYFQFKLITGYFNSDVRYYRFYDKEDNEVSHSDLNLDYVALGMGMELGHQWIINDMICLDLQVGYQIAFQLVKQKTTINNLEYQYNIKSGINHMNPWWTVGPGSMLEFRAGMGFCF
ncbi:MAG: hypothetical protein NTU44_03975 [Bacteroidetes bacterium]|nr:hypothetical protein [Bacteroidota bacterium]